MTWRRLRVTWLVCLVLAVFMVACSTLRENPLPENQTSQQLGEKEDGYITTDDLYLQIAEQVPGYGGLFFEKEMLNFYIKDSDKLPLIDIALLKTELLTAFADIFPGFIETVSLELFNSVKELPLSTLVTQVNIVPGEYSFLELATWYEKVRGLIILPEVVMTDIRGGKNRLELGIVSEADRSTVEQELDKLGIPREAVIITVTGNIEQTATLRDKRRPIKGGLLITRLVNGGNVPCTLGFIAQHGGSYGFVTNSHCIPPTGDVNQVRIHQNLATVTGTLAGYEALDPPYNPCSESSGGCRASDSAFVVINSATTYSFGQIARTVNRSLSASSVGIDANNPYLRITGEKHVPVETEVVDKIGQATGWTYGRITNDCAGFDSGGRHYPCQNVVNTVIGGGDSGSPIFKYVSSTSPDTAVLYGVAWGKWEANGDQLIFSAMRQIERDLGPLGTF